MGYPPRLILEARRINDEMGFFLADRAIREAMLAGLPVRDAQAAVLGLTFKENVPDLRNTRVVDVISRMEQYGLRVQVADPMVTNEMAQHEYGLTLDPARPNKTGGSILVLAVAHAEYCALGMEQLKKLIASRRSRSGRSRHRRCGSADEGRLQSLATLGNLDFSNV